MPITWLDSKLLLGVVVCATIFVVNWIGTSLGWTAALLGIIAIVAALLMFILAAQRTEYFLILIVAVFTLNQTLYFVGNRLLDPARWAVLGIFGGVTIVQLLGKRTFRRLTTADFFAVLFLGYAVFSTIYSIDAALTLQRALSLLLLYLAIFWGAWEYADRFGEEKLIEPILVVARFTYFLGFLLIPIMQTSWQRDGRFRGVLINPNSIGLLTAILLPLVVWKIQRDKYWLDILLAAAMIGSLALAASRNGIVAGATGLIYLLNQTQSRRALLTIGAFLLGLYVLLSYTPVLSDQLSNNTALARLFSDDALTSGSGRLEAWAVARSFIERRPLLGYGFGTETAVWSNLSFDFTQFQGGLVHNSYLGMTLQLGIVGATLFFAPPILLLAKQAWRERHQAISPFQRTLQAVLLAGFISAIFESWPYSVGNAFSFPFWMCVMLLARRVYGISTGEPSNRTSVQGASVKEARSTLIVPLHYRRS